MERLKRLYCSIYGCVPPDQLDTLKGTDMIRKRPALILLIVLLATVLPAAYARQNVARDESPQVSTDEFRWNGRVAQGHAIEIKGVNGGIQAGAASGDQVEVIAEKRGRRNDPREVKVQVIEHADGVTICAVYPDTDPNHPNICEPGPKSHMSVHNNDVSVSFTVRVPSGVRFIGRTVNGGVTAESIGSDAEAHTVNGGIRVSASGFVRATTVNGSITASFGKALWTNSLEFKTVNGSINLGLPSDTSSKVEADTLNGDIVSEFPLTVEGRFSRRHLSGTIGGGGDRELLLKTVNGSIHLNRR
jgi:hypothetical protein